MREKAIDIIDIDVNLLLKTLKFRKEDIEIHAEDIGEYAEELYHINRLIQMYKEIEK